MRLNLENTWFAKLNAGDLINYFYDNFQASPRIIDMHTFDNNSVLEIECTDLTDNSKFIIYMGEYGFYDLNNNDIFEFNPLVKNSDYESQTINLAILLYESNKGFLINNKNYNEYFVDFHKNKIIEFEKEDKEIER